MRRYYQAATILVSVTWRTAPVHEQGRPNLESIPLGRLIYDLKT